MKTHTTDILIVGGGLTGVTAALAAAQNGAAVTLIEMTSALGGMATNGLVPALAPFNYNDPKGEPWIRGLAWEFVKRLDQADALFGLGKEQWWKLFDKERSKLVLDRWTQEKAIQLRFQTTVVDAEVADNAITTLTTASKAGLERWQAHYYIDATGDADLAHHAHVSCETTPDPMPPTYCFALTNIDRKKLKDVEAIQQAIITGKAQGRLRNPEDHRGAKDLWGPDIMTFNYNHVYEVDCLDPDSLSAAYIEGRETAFEFLDYLRETVPGCEDIRMASLAHLMGVRETRRIQGRFHLTGAAYFESQRHDDDIAVYDYACDLHAAQPTAESREEYYHLYYEKITQPGDIYGIPYRCMLPKDLTNLAVAGRCVSCDRIMLSSLRVMPSCMAMGQAAGTAAALALDANSSFPHINVLNLKDALRENGVFIPD